MQLRFSDARIRNFSSNNLWSALPLDDLFLIFDLRCSKTVLTILVRIGGLIRFKFVGKLVAQKQCYQFVPSLNWIAFLSLLDHESDRLLVNREQVIVLQTEVEQDLAGI